MTASLRTVSGVIALVAIAGVQTIDVARAQSERKPDFISVFSAIIGLVLRRVLVRE
jgi:hypothetical protein